MATFFLVFFYHYHNINANISVILTFNLDVFILMTENMFNLANNLDKNPQSLSVLYQVGKYFISCALSSSQCLTWKLISSLGTVTFFPNSLTNRFKEMGEMKPKWCTQQEYCQGKYYQEQGCMFGHRLFFCFLKSF